MSKPRRQWHHKVTQAPPTATTSHHLSGTCSQSSSIASRELHRENNGLPSHQPHYKVYKAWCFAKTRHTRLHVWQVKLPADLHHTWPQILYVLTRYSALYVNTENFVVLKLYLFKLRLSQMQTPQSTILTVSGVTAWHQVKAPKFK